MPSHCLPDSMAVVTGSNRPKPLWQPPLTASPTASGAAPEALSFLLSGAAKCCRAFCGAGTGAARGCCSGSGVSGTGPGWSPSPPGAVQPPSPPSLRGRAGQAQVRSSATRVAGQQVGQTVSGALAAQGCGSPYAGPRGGGTLEPGLHSASAVIGRGGGPNPPQPHLHLRARMGERTARDLGRVAPWRIPRRREAQVLPSRRETLGGAGGGKGLIYLYTTVHRCALTH